MIAAIVFDLDGTLIDSAPDVRAALNALLAEEGRRALSLEEVQSLVGDGAQALIADAFALTGPPAPKEAVGALVARYLGFYAQHPADHTVVYPGAAACLDHFSTLGIKLGICTNKPHAMTLMVLDALGLSGRFAAVVGGDAAPVRKPDGGHILETLRRMGVEGRPALMVGDSRTDVVAARHAGLPVVAVRFGYARMDPRELGADRLIDHLDQLPAVAVEFGQ